MTGFLRKHLVKIELASLACFGLLLYAGNFQHEYHLDSGHLLLQNHYVRSLKHIPRYFVDPLTLTAYPPNADYRPILQLTYALNYAISGYDTWSWHLFQILFHFGVTWGLYCLSRKLLILLYPDHESRFPRHAPYLVALIFLVHPAASGVVNYLSARSSLLTAALLVPAFVSYLDFSPEGGARRRIPWLAALCYALALFTKVEAVGGLLVLLLLEFMMRRRDREKSAGEARTRSGERLSGGMEKDRRPPAWARLAPFLLVTLGYAVIRIMVGLELDVETRSNLDSASFFCTQLTAWWFYVRVWVAPVRLVADDLTYPVFHSLLAPEVLLAVSGLAIVMLILWQVRSREPILCFGVLAYLALLAPTSTFFPLAEMVNEHRPYLPLGMLSMGVLIPLLAWLARPVKSRPALGRLWLGLFGLLMVALATLTLERNQVFRTHESYWADVLGKAPSARAYVNYGLVLQGKGQLDRAIEHYRRSLELAPNWFITLVNLGLALERRGDLAEAEKHLDRAVDLERDSSVSLVYRGQFHLRRKDYQSAWRDFQAATPRSRDYFVLHRGLATAAAGLNRPEEAIRHTRRCFLLDPAATEQSIVAISTPFWESPDRFTPGIRYYQVVDRMFPDRWWIRENIVNLSRKAGIPPPAQP